MRAWLLLSLSSTFDRRQKSVDKTPTAKSANPDLIPMYQGKDTAQLGKCQNRTVPQESIAYRDS